jgi:hypothetical protein
MGRKRLAWLPRIYVLIAANEFVQWLRRGAGSCSWQPRTRLLLLEEEGMGRDRKAYQSKA